MSDELDLLIELCNMYDSMGTGLKFSLTQVLDGDGLDRYSDIALREMNDWLQLLVPFLNDSKEVVDLIDDIEMYLFGRENGYDQCDNNNSRKFYFYN